MDLLVEDLLRLFGEAVAAKGKPAPSGDERSESTATTRDSFSFMQARQLSVRLAQVCFEEMARREDKTVFLKLANVIAMQAR